MKYLPTPMSCLVCGIDQRGHGRQYDSEAGMHPWLRPTQQQILARMRARRTHRLNAEPPKYHAVTGWAADHSGEEGIPYCADCKTDGCRQWIRIQARLDQQRWGIPSRTKHALHAQPGGWGGNEPF